MSVGENIGEELAALGLDGVLKAQQPPDPAPLADESDNSGDGSHTPDSGDSGSLNTTIQTPSVSDAEFEGIMSSFSAYTTKHLGVYGTYTRSSSGQISYSSPPSYNPSERPSKVQITERVRTVLDFLEKPVGNDPSHPQGGGLQPFQAQAFVGSLLGEDATLDPGLWQIGGGGGLGIAQWDRNRQNAFIAWAGHRMDDASIPVEQRLKEEIAFTVYEGNTTEKRAWDAIRASKDMAGAVWASVHDYERSGNQVNDFRIRMSNARGIESNDPTSAPEPLKVAAAKEASPPDQEKAQSPTGVMGSKTPAPTISAPTAAA